MNYFVTGATGFIGRFLVARLLARPDSRVFALVRPGSEYKLDALRKRLEVGPERLVGIQGDLTRQLLGVSRRDRDDLGGQIRHFFHLGAIYDLEADDDQQRRTNIEGTRNALRLAAELKAGCFHHVSSIAAAGLYQGTFREEMFDEAGELVNAYLRTKHESEAVVRRECPLPCRIYRPSMVVGHSATGEMDKVDGPYYFFKLIQRLGDVLPPWVPLIGIEGGKLNIVPVDFVADALDHIAHLPGQDGKCFHLTADRHYSVGEVMNIFAAVADAPKMPVRLDTRILDGIPSLLRRGVATLPPARFLMHQTLESLDIPEAALRFITWPTTFDNTSTRAALEGTGIVAPELESCAQVLWDYWANHLDPDRDERQDDGAPPVTLEQRVAGRVVLITGATSGIGKATALKLGRAGARVLIVARHADRLAQTLREIEQLGGQAQAYCCDISHLDEVDRLVREVLADHGHVDVLINNAGRSIRRSLVHSLDRFHDFQRTMQLNYFGALRLITGLLPGMLERRQGHVINVSSIGVLTNAPRFSAYIASKAALDAFTRCAAAELAHEGVCFTTVNMPLVRTPMIAPTRLYSHLPSLSPSQAADMLCEAVVRQPRRIATSLGVFGQIMHFLTPRITERVMNTGYRIFSDSRAALGRRDAGPGSISREQAAFSRLFKGIHW